MIELHPELKNRMYDNDHSTGDLRRISIQCEMSSDRFLASAFRNV